eukprot:m.163442 g.163442  ORF g.163442 m.163442 type:complete len:196 (-) comp53083_c0_seq2:160-747(-)
MLTAAIVLALTACACALNPVPGNLNATAYLGRWYQMYDNDFSALTYERNAVCVTADYGINSERNISVFNANRVKLPNGQLNTIVGYAIQSATVETELTVKFPQTPEPAPYWIVQLGPQVSYDDATCAPCYAYAVVSDEYGLSLFVLARNPADYVNTYNSTVYAELIEQGFTKDYNKPIETYQNEACEYAPKPSSA